MKRVLFVGDNHIDEKTPENRTDNYLEAVLRKLKECLVFAETEKLDAVVFLGDVFDKREVGPLARNGTLEILLSQSNGDPWSFKKYVVVGNHDIQSSHPLENSSLGTLIQAGAFIKTDHAEELNISFAHFYNDLDLDISNGALANYPAMIWACHASFYDAPTMHDSSVVLFNDTKLHDETKIVISGHIHKPMEMKRADGKIFVNPGCIGRRSANKDNFNRDLKVFLLEYDVNGTIHNMDYVLIESAKHHTEVFKVEEIELKKAEKQEAKEFLKQITAIKSNNWTYTSFEDKIEKIKEFCIQSNVDQKVTDIIIDALNTANLEKEKSNEQ